MATKIVGLEDVDYTKKDGNRVQALAVYVTYEDERVKGLATDKYFLGKNAKYPPNLAIGQEIRAYYNKYGRVDEIAIVK